MMENVQNAPQYVDNEDMPSLDLGNGKQFFFPVGIFQFAFGLLDLYYKFHEEKYKAKFRQCADWALAHQMETGAWIISHITIQIILMGPWRKVRVHRC